MGTAFILKRKTGAGRQRKKLQITQKHKQSLSCVGREDSFKK